MILLNPTTSTGLSVEYSLNHPSDRVAMQVTHTSTAAVATTVTLQGSLDGAYWFNLGAQQSYNTNATTVYVSTGSYLTGWVRANVDAHTSTGTVAVSALSLRN